MTTRVSKLWSTTVAALLLAAPALAQTPPAQEDVVIQSFPGGHHAPGHVPMVMRLGHLPSPTNGIPPHLVEKLGIPRDVAQRVQDLTFESNEALIPLEADLKRAQLRLERLMSAPTPDERAVSQQVEEVGRAETAVRRNRVTLMVQIKKMLGPDLWQKLEAEMKAVRFERHLELHKGGFGRPDEPENRTTPAPSRKP
ncbi:periplasmic heavy metal sensor [Pyxidicoccus fallax]|uniref:Periplasmic heavy metal sensor n=1 Tax=Pyxidicoccus fallax TaxID=394095 RepID=A0A848LJ48_9BACT|nr:periplasmic heavy metal sensor [Pyxidicoccus fallax]NMO17767.1 periplasmic heavy metal sensor [Pyxidicoccus fallax]NPC78210.1 periplasmic heavy metal sensor [Pyxidicoccus fallax]